MADEGQAGGLYISDPDIRTPIQAFTATRLPDSAITGDLATGLRSLGRQSAMSQAFEGATHAVLVAQRDLATTEINMPRTCWKSNQKRFRAGKTPKPEIL
jgi:hypothetical protein